jgi:hypothetical protein
MAELHGYKRKPGAVMGRMFHAHHHCPRSNALSHPQDVDRASHRLPVWRSVLAVQARATLSSCRQMPEASPYPWFGSQGVVTRQPVFLFLR